MGAVCYHSALAGGWDACSSPRALHDRQQHEEANAQPVTEFTSVTVPSWDGYSRVEAELLPEQPESFRRATCRSGVSQTPHRAFRRRRAGRTLMQRPLGSRGFVSWAGLDAALRKWLLPLTSGKSRWGVQWGGITVHSTTRAPQNSGPPDGRFEREVPTACLVYAHAVCICVCRPMPVIHVHIIHMCVYRA